MNGIQILLISGIAFLYAYYVLRIKNAFIDLLVLFVLAAMGVFFVLMPDKATDIASRLGVGRGTDLLFYLCILLFLFIILKLYARIRKIEQNLTLLVRKKAKEEAQKFS
jgi:small membrane protein